MRSSGMVLWVADLVGMVGSVRSAVGVREVDELPEAGAPADGRGRGAGVAAELGLPDLADGAPAVCLADALGDDGSAEGFGFVGVHVGLLRWDLCGDHDPEPLRRKVLFARRHSVGSQVLRRRSSAGSSTSMRERLRRTTCRSASRWRTWL